MKNLFLILSPISFILSLNAQAVPFDATGYAKFSEAYKYDNSGDPRPMIDPAATCRLAKNRAEAERARIFSSYPNCSVTSSNPSFRNRDESCPTSWYGGVYAVFKISCNVEGKTGHCPGSVGCR